MDNPLLFRLRHTAGLEPDEVSAVERLLLTPEQARARATVLHEGSSSGLTHFVMSGWAARCQSDPDGARQIAAFLLPGDFCDLHESDCGKLDHDVVALTPVRIGRIDSDQLMALESSRPAIARAMWQASLAEQRILRAWITNIGLRDAVARIAHLLCELRVRLRMAGLVGDHQYSLPVTQEELAQSLGVTPVHTNRILQSLRADRVIHLSERVLTILDPPRLEALASFRADYLGVAPR